MHYERMLAELFEEEDRAREMATKLADIARASPAAVAAERDSLLAFLRGPIERHFAFEEQAIFPKLVEHDLGPEVQVATKQHDSLRQLAAQLAACDNGGDLGALVFDIARLLLHHTNFEGDYIYPELTHEEWRELMKRTVEEKTGADGATATGAEPPQTPMTPQAKGSVPAEPSVNS